MGPVHESAGGRPGEGLVPKETTGVWPVAEHRLSGLGGKGSVCQAPTLASGWGEERESPGCLWELVCLQAWGEVPAGRPCGGQPEVRLAQRSRAAGPQGPRGHT